MEGTWNKSVDGVKVRSPSQDDLYSYESAANKLQIFKVPELFDSKDPQAKVFFALFDGTGNHMHKDPEHTTNVGLLNRQMERLSSKHQGVASYYKEGPGTQGGILGLADAATGSTYQSRIEQMYDKFSLQSAQWLKEDSAVKICVVSLGFSRGAEQAAGFTRLVDERGVQNIASKHVEQVASGLKSQTTYSEPPLIPPGRIPQALALYDPVGSGGPTDFDRRPPPSVVTGIQINAADEYRVQFPSSKIIPQGVSEDQRFLGVTTAGAHSDIGGGYLLNGLSSRNFNLMASYLNGVLGGAHIKFQDVPLEPKKTVIHDTPWYFPKDAERKTIGRIAGQEAYGGLPVQAVDISLREKYAGTLRPLGALAQQQPADAKTRHAAAQTFMTDDPDMVVARFPNLKTAYAALDVVKVRVARMGLTPVKTKEATEAATAQIVSGIRTGEISLDNTRDREHSFELNQSR